MNDTQAGTWKVGRYKAKAKSHLELGVSRISTSRSEQTQSSSLPGVSRLSL